MAKRKWSAASLNAISDELASFLDEFDPEDAEDAQLRTDALISSLIRAGVLKESRSVKKFRLHMAIEAVQLPIPNREAVVAQAEMFHDLIDSYGGEPDEADMETAKTILEDIARALKSAISVKIKKGKRDSTLFDDIRGHTE